MKLEDILTLKDAEEYAKKQLPKQFADFIEGGAGNETTVHENKDALSRIKIRPRMMRDVSQRSMETTILGHKVSMPIGMSPTALQKFCHPDGDKATAKACDSVGSVMVVSTWASFTTEEVMKACPPLLCFQQMFLTKPRSVAEDMVRRAEKCNVKALVVTLDQPVYGNNIRNIRNSINFETYPSYHNRHLHTLYQTVRNDLFETFFNSSQTWNDIVWLKSITSLPVIVKGVITKEDALEAIKHGVDAIWVSNHGGRQLDCLPATIDILPEIVQSVNGRCEVYVDGGFRTGLDVFKGLALGARAVFVGRPIMYGLACDGTNGVKNVFDLLKKELDNTMALAGCRQLSDINGDFVTGRRCKCNL